LLINPTLSHHDVSRQANGNQFLFRGTFDQLAKKSDPLLSFQQTDALMKGDGQFAILKISTPKDQVVKARSFLL
jgi:hypothetical protein